MRKFLIFLVILVGLLVAADRIGAVVAGREIASRVQSAYNLPSKPSVSVRGFVIPVTGLPLHLSVNAVTVVPGGVRVSASAANVAFTSHS